MSNAECIRCVFRTQTAVTSLCKVGEHWEPPCLHYTFAFELISINIGSCTFKNVLLLPNVPQPPTQLWVPICGWHPQFQKLQAKKASSKFVLYSMKWVLGLQMVLILPMASTEWNFTKVIGVINTYGCYNCVNKPSDVFLQSLSNMLY